MDISRFLAEDGGTLSLAEIKPNYSAKYKSKEKAEADLVRNIEKMAEQQERLYAQDKYSLLIIFQGMDTAGKDGVIKHVMSGLNPQATQVFSFKQPSQEEMDHDYLWRISKNLPERGRIGIFNRSHYEEVLVVRVHDLIRSQKLPEKFITDDIWKDRFHQIREYEKYLYSNGIIPIKIFLHISKEEQKARLLDRIDDKAKNWKVTESDIAERQYWDEYQKCYEEAINETSTKSAPWYVVPADRKWFARLAVSEIIVKTLEKWKLEYPEVTEEQQKVIAGCREKLLAEE